MRNLILPAAALFVLAAAAPAVAQSPMSLQPLANSNPDNAKDTRSKKTREADEARAKAKANAAKKAQQAAREKAAASPHAS